MLKKQDRQGVRTAADLERKYDFNEMMETAKNAQKTAEDALRIANSFNKDEIVNAVLSSVLTALQTAQSTNTTEV